MAPGVHPQMSGSSQLHKFRFKRLTVKAGDSYYSYTKVLNENKYRNPKTTRAEVEERNVYQTQLPRMNPSL